MKKMKRFVYVGAIALLSGVGFTACSSSDDAVVENNPTYNPETGDVNVNFVFNVSTANEPTMRMTAANTQATLDQTFRGITDARLGTFSLGTDGLHVTNPSTEANKLHNLGTVIASGKLNPNETSTSTDVTKSRRVLELSLASGTNSLLFYGKAIKDGSDLEQGKITMNIAETPSNTSISMCKIVPDVAYEAGSIINQTALGQYQKLMAGVLTYIINSGISNQTVTFGGESKSVTLNWKDYVTVTKEGTTFKLSKPEKDPSDNTKTLSLLSEKLASSFVTLNTIHSGELRAGYGAAIAYMASDLITNVSQVVEATPLNMEEAVAMAVAGEIKRRIELFFQEATTGSYEWKSIADVKTVAVATFTTSGDIAQVTTGDLNEFPAFFNLPLGSVILELAIKEETGVYTYTYNYLGSVETYAMGGGTGSTASNFDPKNYMYPAELCYFGNSPIRTTNETKVATNYPDGVANWDNETSWTSDWDGARVLSSTRSVAMKENINYGTALLKSQVRYGAKILYDNNKALQNRWTGANEENNTINVSDGDDNFELTGILVGGQNPEVGWNYIAKSTEDGGFGSMVYDKVGNIVVPKVGSAATSGEPTTPVYTLLWDNWDQSLKGSKQNDVYVAVEFKNNSKNFYGQNNLIRHGATFYIVG